MTILIVSTEGIEWKFLAVVINSMPQMFHISIIYIAVFKVYPSDAGTESTAAVDRRMDPAQNTHTFPTQVSGLTSSEVWRYRPLRQSGGSFHLYKETKESKAAFTRRTFNMTALTWANS